MIKIKLFVAILLFFLITFFCKAQNFGGNVPSVKWKQINTSKARIIFPSGLDSQANRMANVMQLMDSTTSKTIGGHLRKWDIILQNQTTIPNAYVRMAPMMSELFMTPAQDNFSTGSIRWDDNLITHESRHIQQFSNFNKGFTKLFSFLLGQEGQLFANGLLLPDYFFEGDAVWQETLVTAQGRGRMPSFLNGFKALWLQNKNYSWMKYRSGSLKDFVPDHYPLGYILLAYGYEKYGDDFWNKVTDDAVSFKRFFNNAIEKHSGVPFKKFRQDAVNYFKARSFPGSKNKLEEAFNNYITPVKKNNVIDYLFPNFIGADTILVTKKSYKTINAFYVLVNGKEEKLRVKNFVLDDYYSYNNGKVVYASYQSDSRWTNRDYSVLQLLDIQTKKQRQLTFKSKYFSPDINKEGTEILAVHVNTDGTNNLHRLSAATGKVIVKLPNTSNYFFTQTKYINSTTAVSAVRSPEGTMGLIKVDLVTGATENLMAMSFNVLGYPFVKGDTVFFTMMDKNADKIFAITLSGKKMFRITNNLNGVYSSSVSSSGNIVFSAFTADGYRLATITTRQVEWEAINTNDVDYTTVRNNYTPNMVKQSGSFAINKLIEKQNTIIKYKRSGHLFNFHSWRPVIADPEFGYTFFSDNVLSSFSNNISYTYNRNDKSHTIGFNSAYAGLFPVVTVGAEESFNRTRDTALGKSVQFNTATLKAGFAIPLNFIGGRTNKFLNFGAAYNVEQFYYPQVSKNVFKNRALNYTNTFLSFSNVSRRARQHINPRWAQSVTANYRDAINIVNSYKLVTNSAFYFPGLAINHSLVINGAYQKRDSLPDIFSNNFSYARGYEALSTRRMFKVGVNYHFPLCYPDWGIGGVIYFQRIRVNTFYDYNNAKARISGVLTEITNRSTGAELYFDTKVWNTLPVSVGIRFARLLDKDLRNPGVKNRWEIIVPVGLIPD